jgi:co-chaperonin GroES (HSP10)
MSLNQQIKPLKNKVLVHNIEQGEKTTKSGIILRDDDGKSEGIRPRWAEVYAVGSEVDDIKIGEWVLISHGRWSRGIDLKDDDGNVITTIRQVDYPDAILLVNDVKPF